jgi:hypothetical protein
MSLEQPAARDETMQGNMQIGQLLIMLTFSTDGGGIPDETRSTRADRRVALHPALGVHSARLGGARILASLIQACKVLGAIGVAGAFGLGRCTMHMQGKRGI